MSASQVRVRFAPSPTGFLHVGGVRTALFNWLYAKRHGGVFLLRIEDTDFERSEERFTQDILKCMTWLGLTPDEPIVYQSKRMEIYAKLALQWIDAGQAYRCTCTEAELTAMREAQQAAGKKPKYDGRCREKKIGADCGKPFVVRAKLPETGSVGFEDLIHGPIQFQNAELDDFVLIRSSGAPTYNFTVVVDDVEMRMTHIIRGDDHINNTPKQVHLYRFLDYPLPKFAHLPMILGTDKKKLSKRHLDTSANAYRADGYLPEALLNFLVRLGWSHGDQEVFTPAEMGQLFDFDSVQKSAAVFNPEKLLWVSGEHLKRADSKRLCGVLAEDFAEALTSEGVQALTTELGVKLVGLVQGRTKTLKELAEQLKPLIVEQLPSELPLAELKWNKSPELKAPLQTAISEVLSAWTEAGRAPAEPTQVEAAFKSACEKHGQKLGDLAQVIRIALTGRTTSPSLFELIAWLPWKRVETRLARIQTF